MMTHYKGVRSAMLPQNPLDEFFEARIRENIQAGADEVGGRNAPGERFYAEWIDGRGRVKNAFERTAAVLRKAEFTGVEADFDNGSLFLRVLVCDEQRELKLTPNRVTKEVEFTITGMEGGPDGSSSPQPSSYPLVGLTDAVIASKLLAFAYSLSKLRAEAKKASPGTGEISN